MLDEAAPLAAAQGEQASPPAPNGALRNVRLALSDRTGGEVTSATKEVVDAFKQSVEQLEKAIKAAVIVSGSNIGVEHTGRQNRALFLFAKLIAHDLSLSAIVYKYLGSSKNSALLDHFSVAALCRTIIDASLMTMYISHPDLNRDSWNLRRYVLYLHDLLNRKRFLTSSSSQDAVFFSMYPERKAAMITKIRRFAKSVGISEADIVKLISGQKVFVEGARGAVREAGWNVKQFDANQSYLSAFVHSHPVSFMRAEQHKISFSSPSDFQITFCTSAIGIATYHTARVEQRMAAFCVSGTGDPLGQVDD